MSDGKDDAGGCPFVQPPEAEDFVGTAVLPPDFTLSEQGSKAEVFDYVPKCSDDASGEEGCSLVIGLDQPSQVVDLDRLDQPVILSGKAKSSSLRIALVASVIFCCMVSVWKLSPVLVNYMIAEVHQEEDGPEEELELDQDWSTATIQRARYNRPQSGPSSREIARNRYGW